MYPHLRDYRTHFDIFGATQTRKTGLVRHCELRRLLDPERIGFCVLCFDQAHYRWLMETLVYLDPQQPVVPIDLSHGDAVPCNWITNLDGEEIGAHADRIANAIAGVFGAKDLSLMLNYADCMRGIVRWCASAKQPIQTAMDFLDFNGKGNIQEAMRMTSDPIASDALRTLLSLERRPDWAYWAGSTWNRLQHFKNSEPLRKVTSTKSAISIRKCVAKDAIIIVNLTPSGLLSWDAAAMFSGLLVSELSRCEGDYYLDCDEAWAYTNFEAARLLDTMAKKGLRVTLIHHSIDQFQDERVRASIRMNCQLKAIFGGQSFDERKAMVGDLCPAALNRRVIKQRFHALQTRLIERGYSQDSDGSSDGANEFGEWSSQSVGTAYGTRFEPEQELVESGVIEMSPEEKTNLIAMRMELKPGEYWMKAPDKAWKDAVPHLRRHRLPEGYRLLFDGKHALPPAQETVSPFGENHASKPRKKPRKLS